MVLNGRERVSAPVKEIIPGVMEIQAGAMVYEPELLVPYQHVRISGGAVDVGYERIKPHNGRGQVWIYGFNDGVVGQ